MTSNTQSTEGLVQKLLFPAYANSGANDTYQAEPEPTPSEAETDVYDNRTAKALLSQAHKLPNRTQQKLQISPRWNAPARTVPPLFASTQPKRPPTTLAQTPIPPPSPPKLARKPMAVSERSLSTVALADGEEQRPTNTDDALPSLQKANRADPSSPQPSSPASTEQTPPLGKKDEQKDDPYDSEHKETDTTTMWEEEATPEQTAFAKDVIFRHRPLEKTESSNHKDTDDVSSTASEMGTVVGEARLQDLDNDLTQQQQQQQQQNGEGNTDSQFMSSDLNMPVLEGVPQTDSGLTAEASQRLSQAIRRIGSGIKTGLPTRSSPSTPRAATADPLTLSPRTPTSKQQPPASFLLRSPGSAAFCDAKSNTREKSTASKRNQALLSPRFMHVPPSIDETEESSGPALPELQTGSIHPANPLQLARACFSFDAYYHDRAIDDDEYDLKVSSSLQRSKRSSPSSRSTRHRGSTQIIQSSKSWDGRWGMHSSTYNSVDVEREDALDLLACLVDRGATLEANEQILDESKMEELKIAAKDDPSLDYLMRSHEYAMEMSRASQSAAAWLKSIGRDTNKKDNSNAKDKLGSVDLLTASAGTKKNDPMDLASMKALWRTAQKELEAKSSQMEELNQELAKCRAEIGRLKTQQHQQQEHLGPFQSPNRSIFDDPNEEEEEDDEEDVEEVAFDRDDSYLDRSFPSHQSAYRPNLFVDTGEVNMYKQALEEANKRIKELYQKAAETETDEVAKPAPIVTVANSRAPSSPGNTADTMESLDADNFETQWSDLVPSLPPPPDHGLRSPIVQTVLEAWTRDVDLHRSLLAWMESVLSGASPHDIPPLAISNLDSEVRDGLVIHVLPLLLRRADIRVEVQTRTQRRTTYDLAVSIEASASPLIDIPMRRRNWENLSLRSEAGASVTHSSVTALMDNHSYQAASAFRERRPSTEDDHLYGQSSVESRPFAYPRQIHDAATNNAGFSYDEMTEDLSAQESAHPSGLISALGDAIGGLMLRRPTPRETASPSMAVVGSHLPEAERYRAAMTEEKKAKVQATVINEEDRDKTPTAANVGLTPFASPMQSTAPLINPSQQEELVVEDEQSFHRVVSAPPGRIGVTFVEYRGHAMVQQVASDSPLSGWIFPSDILIAIDEIPVSGMLIRDIIQILRERVDNQRALRIISGHSMEAEFGSLNTSQVGEPTG